MKKLFLLLIIMSPSPAYAYLDAGTGSILVQALVGVVAGVVVFWSRCKAKISQWFNGNKIDE